MGGAIQQLKSSEICAQFQILSIWMHRRILHSPLSISKTDDLPLEQITKASEA